MPSDADAGSAWSAKIWPPTSAVSCPPTPHRYAPGQHDWSPFSSGQTHEPWAYRRPPVRMHTNNFPNSHWRFVRGMLIVLPIMIRSLQKHCPNSCPRQPHNKPYFSADPAKLREALKLDENLYAEIDLNQNRSQDCARVPGHGRTDTNVSFFARPTNERRRSPRRATPRSKEGWLKREKVRPASSNIRVGARQAAGQPTGSRLRELFQNAFGASRSNYNLSLSRIVRSIRSRGSGFHRRLRERSGGDAEREKLRPEKIPCTPSGSNNVRAPRPAWTCKEPAGGFSVPDVAMSSPEHKFSTPPSNQPSARGQKVTVKSKSRPRQLPVPRASPSSYDEHAQEPNRRCAKSPRFV